MTEQGHEPHPPGAYADEHAGRKRPEFPEASPAQLTAVSTLRMRLDACGVRYRALHEKRHEFTEGQSSMLTVARGHLTTAKGYLGQDGHAGFERAPSVELGTRFLAWGDAYMDVVDGLNLAEAFSRRLAEIRALTEHA